MTKSVHRCLPKCSNPSMHNSTFARMMHKKRLSQKKSAAATTWLQQETKCLQQCIFFYIYIYIFRKIIQFYNICKYLQKGNITRQKHVLVHRETTHSKRHFQVFSSPDIHPWIVTPNFFKIRLVYRE